MRLGLRMGLNSRQGGGSDLPSLDLAFALDRSFTTDPAAAGNALITSRRGPAAKFSRGSGATQVNAAGLIEYAPENLMINSGNVSLMSRTDVPVAISQTGGPLGSYYTLGVNATNGFHIYRNSGVTPAASASSMMWVLAKRGTARYLRMGGGSASTFDWDTLTFSSISTTHSVGDPVAVGDGWYWLPILRGLTDLIDLAPSSSSGVTFSSNETANVTVEVAAIQVSRSGLLLNAAPTYYPTTTSVFYGPRFDHDPATLASKGLLIEEGGRTNLLSRSEEFDSSAWDASGGRTLTVTADDTASPCGVTNADKLTVSVGVAVYQVIQSLAAVTSGVAYTVSLYVKPDQVTKVRLWMGTLATLPIDTYFDLTGSGYVISAYAGSAASITQVANGWYRIQVTATAGASASTSLRFGPSAGSGTTVIGNGVDSFYAWGAQFEAGAFATSYIPTTSGTAARSADVCSIDGADFISFCNPNEFSAFCDFSFLSASAAGPMVPIALNQSAANGVLLYKGTLSAGVSVYHVTANSAIGSVSVNVIAKGAFAYDGDSTVGVLDGGSVSPETGSSSLTFVEMTIGRNRTGVHPMSGHIARIQYFRKRLSNAKLQTLTTP